MPAILYPNDGDSSQRNSQNSPKKTSRYLKNGINISYENLQQVASEFIRQLSICTLHAQDVRILSTIYCQTIACNKLEDDMNGAYLEQLTGICSDHANKSIHRLEVLNIIITRKGYYGKWISINFDFDHWGKLHPETQTNDPYYLLINILGVVQ